MAEFGFPKDSRLLNAADYKAVFDNAQYKVSCRQFLMLAVSNDRGAKRLGMVIAKKNVAKAVQRNRIKRQIRGSFRKTRPRIEPLDVVVLARKDVDKLRNLQVMVSLNSLWCDLEQKLLGTNKVS